MGNFFKQRRRRLTLEDCRVDWNRYPIVEEDESITYEAISEQERERMKNEQCGYSAFGRIRKSTCMDYFEFDYDPNKLDQYYHEHLWTEDDIAWRGLTDMFNDGWLKSAAYVDWKKDLYYCIEPNQIENFLVEITETEIRIDILQFIVENAEYLLDQDIVNLPFYEYLLSIHRKDQQIRKQNKDDDKFLRSYKPREGDNNSIRLYIEAKLRTDDEFKTYYNTHHFTEVCLRLERELGIAINCNSLKRNMNRKILRRRNR